MLTDLRKLFVSFSFQYRANTVGKTGKQLECLFYEPSSREQNWQFQHLLKQVYSRLDV